MLSSFDDSISRLQRFLDLTLTLTWGVAPGYYISRRRRLVADFCSNAGVKGLFQQPATSRTRESSRGETTSGTSGSQHNFSDPRLREFDPEGTDGLP